MLIINEAAEWMLLRIDEEAELHFSVTIRAWLPDGEGFPCKDAPGGTSFCPKGPVRQHQ